MSKRRTLLRNEKKVHGITLAARNVSPKGNHTFQAVLKKRRGIRDFAKSTIASCADTNAAVRRFGISFMIPGKSQRIGISFVTPGIVETNHEDVVHSAELDCYGHFLATCSSDNSVKVFEIKNDIQVHIVDLKGHVGPVWDVSWAHSKYGNILASCSYDRKIIIWKKSGSSWHKLHEQNSESSVNSVEWAPHEFGMVLACGSSDGSILILTFNTETNNWEKEKISNAHAIGCNSLSWCPESVSRIFKRFKPTGRCANKRIVSGGCDNCVKIWIEKGGRWIEENRLEAHSDWIRHVNWAPSYGTCRTQIASASQDRHVIIWSSTNMVVWTPLTLHVFDDVLWSTSWSFTGKILAVTGSDNKITLWKECNQQWSSINYGHN